MTDIVENQSLVEAGFDLGHWRVEPRSNSLTREGEDKHLENRLMQTLVFLAGNHGRVVSRKELFDSVWQGRVVNEEALSRAISLLRTALGDNAHKPEFIQTIPGVGYRLVAPVITGSKHRAGSAPGIGSPENSIAVLPFLNLSDEAGNEYFSEGISEEILNVLTQVSRFKVAGRTSSFMFKGDNRDIREIGRTLGVAHVLEGSVRKAGSRVRITAQLIKTRDGFHLWSKTFDRELDDIFAVQDEIALAVVDQLKLSLLEPVSEVTETNPEAYALHLQSRYLVRQSTPDSFAKALELSKQVVAIAPDYAEGWNGLASVYCNYAGKGEYPHDKALIKARQAAEKALELNPELASAHSTRAWIATHFETDLKKAARHYQQALLVAPGDLEIISSSANLARSLGRLDTAIALQAYVNERDPMNPAGHTFLGFFYRCAGQYEAAISSYRNALGLSPGILSAQYNIGASRMLQGRLEDALEETMKEKGSGYRYMGLAPIYHALGETEKSDAELNLMIDTYAEEGAYNIGFICAWRGEPDRAFEWLEIALENHDAGLGQINTEPIFAGLREDPRWNPFLERIGMAPHQLAEIEFDVALPA
ncbi:MAG TPA: winged helix-turn-helix domain-containing protein [Xanthomonadales bacterium]|nr:winged helix-turn-helix domain-containing protein [Xanthomonadales bacterium]